MTLDRAHGRPTTATALNRSLAKNLAAGTVAIVVMFAAVGGWATTTEISGAVIANGALVVEGSVKKVQHSTGGIVAELLAAEGQSVAAGDPVIRLDATVTRANLLAVSKNLDYLHARHARLEAERDGLPDVAMPPALTERLAEAEATRIMTSERRLFADRHTSREGQKTRLREQIRQMHEEITGLDGQQQAKGEEIDLIEQELEGLRRLFDKGGTTMSQVNALRRNSARLRGERGQLVASIASERGRILETEVQLLQIDQQMRTEVAAELRDVENQQARLSESEVAAAAQLRQVEIRAPISGIVHRLSVHTVGGVVTPAETIMEIVPQDAALVVEARIAPQDVDQVTPGQPARLRLTAFNRNTTPEISGTVKRISADLETDDKTGAIFYRAAIAIDDEEVEKLDGLALVPGMPAETFIKTGDRTVLSYFAKPIRDHASRIFREG